MSEKARAVTALLVALVLVPGYGSVLHAQDTPKEPAAGAGAKPSAADKPAVPSTGQGRTPVIVAAATDTAEIRVQLTLDAATLEASDLELGSLTNDQNSLQRVSPTIKSASITALKDKSWDVRLTISGLLPFGDNSVPLLYRAVKSRHCGFTRPACSSCHPRMASRSRESGMAASCWSWRILPGPSTRV